MPGNNIPIRSAAAAAAPVFDRTGDTIYIFLHGHRAGRAGERVIYIV